MTLSFLSCKPIAFSKKKIHCPKFLTFNIIVLVEQARFAPNCKSGAGVDLKAVSGGTFGGESRSRWQRVQKREIQTTDAAGGGKSKSASYFWKGEGLAGHHAVNISTWNVCRQTHFLPTNMLFWIFFKASSISQCSSKIQQNTVSLLHGLLKMKIRDDGTFV